MTTQSSVMPDPIYRLTGRLTLPGFDIPAAQKKRQLLALLFVKAGTVVPKNKTFEELWDVPPRTAIQVLHTYIFQLRNGGGSARVFIKTVPPGYCLDIRPSQVDALAFIGQVEQVRLEGDEQQLRDALSRLEMAFGFVRGEGRVLEGVNHGAMLKSWVRYYEETYRTALLLKFEAALMLGRHTAVLSELWSTWREEPMREDFARLLILALYRSNRRVEVTHVYQVTRDRLIEERGLDVCPSLNLLYTRVLQGDELLLTNFRELT